MQARNADHSIELPSTETGQTQPAQHAVANSSASEEKPNDYSPFRAICCVFGSQFIDVGTLLGPLLILLGLVDIKTFKTDSEVARISFIVAGTILLTLAAWKNKEKITKCYATMFHCRTDNTDYNSLSEDPAASAAANNTKK